jgi:hypothetical protein
MARAIESLEYRGRERVRKKLLINVATGVSGLAVSILVGVVLHSSLAGLVTGFGIAILRLVVDIRLNLNPNIPIEISFLNSYTRLRESKCDLFREAAVAKLRDVNAYFDDLAGGQLAVRNQSEVFDLLKLLFCEISFIREIHSTSSGEADEWRTWWGKHYLEIHKAAIKRGVKIQRIFIVRSDDEATSAADIMRANTAHNIIVKYAVRPEISQSDFNNASNCMLFFDRNRVPVYSLQAVHDGEGKFLSALICNDITHIKPVADSYSHIDAMSVLFRG